MISSQRASQEVWALERDTGYYLMSLALSLSSKTEKENLGGEDSHVFLYLPWWRRPSFSVVDGSIWVCGHVCLAAWEWVHPCWLCVSACACPRLSEGCSNCILLMLQKHRKAGPLIQSFMLPLFRLLDLIDKNTEANDQFHGLLPLLSIQGIVSCHLVPPLQRENSNIYDQLL